MVIDVCKELEYEVEYVEDVYSKLLVYINDWVKDINLQEYFYIYCVGGYCSMIVVSIFQV